MPSYDCPASPPQAIEDCYPAANPYRIETWRRVWREGFAPILTTKQLEALKDGLLRDDARLIQGATSSPPPMQCVLDWECEGACLIGYAGWQGDGIPNVGDVEVFFANACFEADQRIGEPAACRYLMNFWDDSPRDEARRQMIEEINRELLARFIPNGGAVTS